MQNPNLEYHKEKLAQIIKDIDEGKAKMYSFEEAKKLMDEHSKELIKKYSAKKAVNEN
nr:hypothetical protein [uncultured Campylobacter sp.]